MSELKLYAVKNDEGKYLLDSSLSIGYPEWTKDLDDTEIFVEKANALTASNSSDGHVVTFVEEPKKVVLSKTQARIVDEAHDERYPANHIAFNSDHEELLMRAFVNGYTVAKEMKYLVYKELGGKQKNKQVAQAYRSLIYLGTVSWFLTNEVANKSNEPFYQFTEAEIEHYGLQDCEKEEVTDDDAKK
ncbi:DUF1642 domain-containing protein [Lacticaseibacillus paracasei subsp. paracasei]|uniref:DUF1642 domain-containing protein n=1 Tax=Lacticaseibacillus paracasei TaxID=1597 RepID=UPI001F2F5C28|nr:DUF1642 domain-containing protein [Lacticaseibacillus paracasei]UJS06793.1 DUF1642 domain-containing protein [Lacticaseibacillus paracasei subsp. paracasei]